MTVAHRPDGQPILKVNAVIFATDLSDWSRNAGEYAAFFAGHLESRLVVAHAFLPSQPAREAEAEGTPASRQRQDVEARLAEEASALSTAALRATPLLVDGIAEQAIPSLAGDCAPSLIALGTHGGSRLSRLAIGSVAEEILRSTAYPCLTVGPRVPSFSRLSASPFRRILYATDLSPASAHAAGFAVFFAEALGAKIDVLHVVHGGNARGADRGLREDFYTALDGIVPRYAREFCEARAFVESGRAHERILEHVKEYSVDLLVLGIRKSPHLGLQMRLQMRTSGAFQLLAVASCPVLTVTG